MNKYLCKLNSICFDAAIGPAILLMGGFAVAAGLAVIALIALVIWLIRRSRRNK